ncbi:PA14 domain-containing protein [Pedobacter arcticus]|uniref:PA14 domain-containing protein n=1 Tax=Pedobacter arcticus TaxID=752140 RepID=UPI0002FCFFC8|nr:PA14 domain-containing protein [Pedobacter arcticus]
MIRKGDVVGLRYDIKSEKDDFEIYDIVKDPSQSNDLKKDSKFLNFQKLFKAEALRNRAADTSAKRPYDEALIPAILLKNEKSGFNWRFFKTNTSWTANEKGLEIDLKGETTSINSVLAKSKKNGLYVFTAYINIPASGAYNFYLKATNKFFIKTHQINMLDADFDYKSGTEKTKKLNLEKGLHPIKIYYKISNSNSKNDIKFEWESATMPRSIIPQSAFYKN